MKNLLNSFSKGTSSVHLHQVVRVQHSHPTASQKQNNLPKVMQLISHGKGCESWLLDFSFHIFVYPSSFPHFSDTPLQQHTHTHTHTHKSFMDIKLPFVLLWRFFGFQHIDMGLWFILLEVDWASLMFRLMFSIRLGKFGVPGWPSS